MVMGDSTSGSEDEPRFGDVCLATRRKLLTLPLCRAMGLLAMCVPGACYSREPAVALSGRLAASRVSRPSMMSDARRPCVVSALHLAISPSCVRLERLEPCFTDILLMPSLLFLSGDGEAKPSLCHSMCMLALASRGNAGFLVIVSGAGASGDSLKSASFLSSSSPTQSS